MDIAILFVVFNRPAETKKVLNAIRDAKPSRLYIASDGPRMGRDAEKQTVAEVRQIIHKIDWVCDVKTLLREVNVGCKDAVSGAIDWFFNHEEEGIILEDDCLPDLSFFSYCKELLEKYRHDSRIMSISGVNFQKSNFLDESSYYFSRYVHV